MSSTVYNLVPMNIPSIADVVAIGPNGVMIDEGPAAGPPIGAAAGAATGASGKIPSDGYSLK